MNRNPGPSVRLAAVGDVALGGEYLAQRRPRGAPLTYPFSPLASSLQGTDVLLVNLEGPIGAEGVPREGRSSLIYNEPEVLDWLSSFPVCVCTLANNHVMDYGAEALRRTQEILSARGIAFVGSGMDAVEASRELRLTVKDLRLAILAFTTDEPHVGSMVAGLSSPGSNGLPDREEVCARVRQLAADVDLIIVLLHWGHEYFHYPSPAQVKYSRSLTAAGAALVIGHHPHVQQGCEQIGDSVVCYSLGNLLLPEMRAENGRPQYRKPTTKQFSILHAELRKDRVVNWKLEGGRCDRGYNLFPYTGNKAARFASALEEMSKPLKRSDYDEFWSSYSLKRVQALQKEALRDGMAKLWMMDLKTIVQTTSSADIRRCMSRLASAVGWRKGRRTNVT